MPPRRCQGPSDAPRRSPAVPFEVPRRCEKPRIRNLIGRIGRLQPNRGKDTSLGFRDEPRVAFGGEPNRAQSGVMRFDRQCPVRGGDRLAVLTERVARQSCQYP